MSLLEHPAAKVSLWGTAFAFLVSLLGLPLLGAAVVLALIPFYLMAYARWTDGR